MTADWYPGIRVFCQHWSHAQTLQNTFETLERTFAEEQDACIDAAKAMVECACRVIIKTLDDPRNPQKRSNSDLTLAQLLGLATKMLKLGEIRHRAFSDLIREYNRLAEALRVLRNEAGTVSHGKDGFISRLSIHHRRAAILAADAIVTFLHEAYLEQEMDPLLTLEPYERFTLSNQIIDKYTSLRVGEDQEEEFLSVTILLPNGDGIPLTIEPSRLLFGVDRQAYKTALNACRDAALTQPEVEEALEEEVI